MNRPFRNCLVPCLLWFFCAGCAQMGLQPFRIFAKEEYPLSRMAYARVQERDGQLTEAHAIYTEALKHSPRSVEATLGLARIEAKSGRQEIAEAHYKRALELSPKSAFAHEEIGNFYAEQERWEEAIQALKQATILAPHEVRYPFSLGVVLAESGNETEALKYLTQSVGEIDAHYNLGYILMEQGNVPRAADHLEQALELSPGHAQARELITKIRNQSLERSSPFTPSQSVTPPVLADQKSPISTADGEFPSPEGSRQQFASERESGAFQLPIRQTRVESGVEVPQVDEEKSAVPALPVQSRSPNQARPVNEPPIKWFAVPLESNEISPTVE